MRSTRTTVSVCSHLGKAARFHSVAATTNNKTKAARMDDLTYKHQVQYCGVIDSSNVTVIPECSRRGRERHRERSATSPGAFSSAADPAGQQHYPIDPPATSMAYYTYPSTPSFDSSSDGQSSSSSASFPRTVEATSDEEPEVLLVPSSSITPPLPSYTRTTTTTHLAHSTSISGWMQEQQLLRQENALLRQRIALQERLARERSAELQRRRTTSTVIQHSNGNDDVELVMQDDNATKREREQETIPSRFEASQVQLARPRTFVRASKGNSDVEVALHDDDDELQPPYDGTVADTGISSFTSPSILPEDTEKKNANMMSRCSPWIRVLVTCLVAVLFLFVVMEVRRRVRICAITTRC